MASDTTAPSPPRSLWISRPWVDLIVGCGAWSLPLLAVAYLVSDSATLALSTTFYSLALVVNYPHYMATVYRAYRDGEWRRHPRYTVWATLALAAAGGAAHVQTSLVPILFTAYVMWSPWHYSGQNYGLLMMFARRGGHQLSGPRQRALKAAFVASYVMLLASMNTGASSDPLVLSLALPLGVAHAIEGVALVVFLAGAGVAVVSLAAGPHRATIAPPLLLLLTQALWFVAPAAVSAITNVIAPQTRYSSGMLALMHSAQYLWITQYFAKREQGALWSAGRYWFAVIAGGILLFLPIPWLASMIAHLDFTASMIVMTAIVNLHHFMIDGVVWKLRDPRVSAALTTDRTVAEGVPQPRRARARHAVAAVAAVAVAALAGLDQWRYRLASRESDVNALQAAAALNPNDSAVQSRLLRALLDAGRFDEARTALDERIAAQPANAEALVNAGVLAHRTGRIADAIQHWQRALSINPDQPQVQLYVAEGLHELARPAEAVPHYRAYLEALMRDGQRAQENPRDAIAVIIKFGDALASSGREADARTQFELAAAIAQRTGLRDLAAQAQSRLDGAR